MGNSRRLPPKNRLVVFEVRLNNKPKNLGHHEPNLNCMNIRNNIKHRGSRAPAPTHFSASLTLTYTSRTGLHHEPVFGWCHNCKDFILLI